MNTYPICDAALKRSERHSFPPKQKSHRHNFSCVWTEASSGKIFVAAKKLSDSVKIASFCKFEVLELGNYFWVAIGQVISPIFLATLSSQTVEPKHNWLLSPRPTLLKIKLSELSHIHMRSNLMSGDRYTFSVLYASLINNLLVITHGSP